MSRIRTVKPEFWTSEQVVECSCDARLLFIGIWNFCDDAGRHPASFKQLKMRVFPGDDCTEQQIANWINELINANLLIEYAVNNKKYWQVTGWHHQKIDKPNYRYPKPDEQYNSTKFDDHSANSNRMVTERSTTSCLRIGKEGKGDMDICKVSGETSPIAFRSDEEVYTGEIKPETKNNTSKLDLNVQAIFQHWQQVMNHPQAKLDEKRQAKIKQALKNYSIDQLKQAIDGCSKTPYNMGNNEDKHRYDDISLILRDASHIERFIANNSNQNNANEDDIMLGAI